MEIMIEAAHQVIGFIVLFGVPAFAWFKIGERVTR